MIFNVECRFETSPKYTIVRSERLLVMRFPISGDLLGENLEEDGGLRVTELSKDVEQLEVRQQLSDRCVRDDKGIFIGRCVPLNKVSLHGSNFVGQKKNRNPKTAFHATIVAPLPLDRQIEVMEFPI